jgi:pheromone shutdown protein TraB
MEVLPGAEFRIAYEEAMSYGARVILGDRPVQVHFLFSPSFFFP